MTPLSAAVQAHLAAWTQPPVWSLIATVFGDMASPRGGVLSTEGLIRILGLVGVAPPAVRTALSRLVADGWLEGSREGRRSSHRMTQRADQETLLASRRIYALPRQDFDGLFDLAVLTGGTASEKQALRLSLAAGGFGQLHMDCLVRPTFPNEDPLAPEEHLTVFTGAAPAGEDGARIIAQAYDLAAIANRHAEFLAAHGGLLSADLAGADPAAALAARLLLIHGYRRLALRDPQLPHSIWSAASREAHPALAAGRAYLALHAMSERQLDLLVGAPNGGRTLTSRFGRDI